MSEAATRGTRFTRRLAAIIERRAGLIVLLTLVFAVVVSTVLMLVYGKKVGHFVEQHPTLKMLALSFLVLIGVNLIAEGAGQHIPKGYTYFAMAFAVGVEMLNARVRATAEPVHLRKPYAESGNQSA